ncbi:GNAT family N-acetyltransferase [Geminicoccaceae bacterium 1502E]|nr:GNAT family N-acetyltransferase [Geminicoccaceae bacterium 1502E]
MTLPEPRRDRSAAALPGEALWLTPKDPRWDTLVARAALADAYHRAAYHALAEARGEGRARLFAWCEGEAFVALPMLLRPLAEIAGLEGETGCDAGSVYGYPGPIASPAPLPEGMPGRFGRALAAGLGELGTVSLFSRLNPLLDQAPLLAGLGEVHEHGPTVSVDLTRSPQERRAACRKATRYDLRRLEEQGFTVAPARSEEELAAFAGIYRENMQRVEADAYYFFDDAYFTRLACEFGEDLVLLLCRKEGALAAGALFFRSGSIAQYHLSATAAPFLAAGPVKLVLDAAAQHLGARGAKCLHLGGGRGGTEDSLFRFKAGFGPDRHPFCTWRWVLDPVTATRLAKRREALRGAAPAGFFPAHRA